MENKFLAIPLKFRQKIYIILGNISLILLFISILQTGLVTVEIQDFLGLTSHLPLVYWIGLGLITLCSIMVYNDDEIENIWIFIFILIIVGLFLFGVGVFAEENARAWSSYYPTAEVNNLLTDFHIDINQVYPLISYQNWPSFHFISAYELSLTHIDIAILTKYMPLFWMLCLTLFTFVIGKSLNRGNNTAFLVSFLALSSFWQIYYYYSPQSFAYLIALFSIMLFSLSIKFSLKNITLSLSSITLIATHFLYSIMFCFALIVQLLRRHKYILPIIISAFILSYYVFIAKTVFEFGIVKGIMTISNIDVGFSAQAEKFSPTTPIKFMVDLFRFSYAGMFGLLLLVSSIKYLKKPMGTKLKTQLYNWIFWIIPVLIFIFVNYGAESIERVYMFCIVPIICLITLLIQNKKILTLLMISFIFLNIPAHYGSDAFLSTFSSELYGSHFFTLNIDSRNLNEIGDLKYVYNSGGDRYVDYWNTSFVRAQIITDEYIETRSSENVLAGIDYVIKGKHDSNFEMYYGTEDSLSKKVGIFDQFKGLARTYDNGGFVLYKSSLTT
jgi:hypothetical protein